MSLISNVRLWKRNHETVKASGKFTLADSFDVAFTLVNSTKGLFVSLPRRKYTDAKGEEKWANDVFCISEDAREEMTHAVMEVYNSDAPSSTTDTVAQTALTKKTSVPF